jgi:predicted O-methyltransferase YrrM
MSGITVERVEGYLEGLLPKRDALLARLEAYADEHDVPIIGPHGGRFLYTIAKLTKPQRILEVGTAIGYSAIWLGRATAQQGTRITTIEINPETAKIARANLKEAGLLEGIEILIGDGLEMCRRLTGPYDLLFIDAAKEQYRAILETMLPKLTPGAVIMADNVLWQGAVAETNPDETTRAIQDFNKYICAHPKLETVIVPLRDGISLSLVR